MDKKTVIDLLRAHLEDRWKEYAAKLPHACLALLGDEWRPIVFDSEPYDTDEYIEELRAITRSHKPRAMAFVTSVDGDQHFYAAVEFPDDPIMRSLVWQIVSDALVNFRMTYRQWSDDEDDNRLFDTASAASDAAPGLGDQTGILRDYLESRSNAMESVRASLSRIVIDRKGGAGNK